jgi:hypothetical protein
MNKENEYLSQESTVWLKAMDRLQEENIILKKRFSDYLKSGKDGVHLEKLESLYNNLLNNDTMLSLLRHEIIDLNEMINKEARRNNSGTKRLDKRQNKIRKDMKLVEEEFERLKQDFISNTERAKS